MDLRVNTQRGIRINGAYTYPGFSLGNNIYVDKSRLGKVLLKIRGCVGF
jgi:hypothetical protein